MAHEQEAGLTGATSATELNESELSQVTAGKTYYGDDVYSIGSGYLYLADRDGAIGYIWEDGQIDYWPCPKCGKPMHGGTWSWRYCDPCNYKAGNPAKAIWNGSVEDLGVAARKAF